MTIELKYLAIVAALTAVMWVPYILNRLAVRGIADAVGYPENPKPQAPWAIRLQKAHGNAVENLVVFAALVLIAHAASSSARPDPNEQLRTIAVSPRQKPTTTLAGAAPAIDICAARPSRQARSASQGPQHYRGASTKVNTANTCRQG